MHVNADALVPTVQHLRHRRLDVPGQHAAVRVAEDDPIGAGFGGRGQRRHRVTTVGAVSIEEVLGVVDHLPALRLH